jgi:HTH-type transcriptional regulator/antitoxin HigA
MMAKKLNMKALTGAWTTLVANVGDIGTIRSEQHLLETAAVLDRLLDEIQGDWTHPVAGLADMLADRIEAWETEHIPQPVLSPASVLRHLMESNGLKQSDMASIMGGQSVVSAVLNGHRVINAKQAAALGKRFCMSPAVFIDVPVDKTKKTGRSKASLAKAAVPPKVDKATSRRETPVHASPVTSRARPARAKLSASL